MSKIYVCRCGERTSRCIQCLDETCNTLREEKKELERQLEEVREFEKEIGRKLIINKIGALSDKELILSLRDYFGEQLKEKGK